MTEAQVAHLRLISMLPVRTINAREYVESVVRKNTNRGIVYEGIEYASIEDARKALRISPKTIYRLLADGRARRLIG